MEELDEEVEPLSEANIEDEVEGLLEDLLNFENGHVLS
jgi:hypothetical protein